MPKDQRKSNLPEETLPEECRKAREILKHGKIWATVEETRSAMRHQKDCPDCTSDTSLTMAEAVVKIRRRLGIYVGDDIFPKRKRKKKKEGKV